MSGKVVLLPDGGGNIDILTPTGVVPCTTIEGGGTGVSTPIPTVLVVDPNGSPVAENGAWSGASTFRTLQAAYDTLPDGVSAVIWMAPGAVGSLTVNSGFVQSLTLRGFSGKIDVGSAAVITNLALGVGMLSCELVDCIVSGQVTTAGDEVTFHGTFVLRNSTIIGNVTLPQGFMFAAARSELQGRTIVCDTLLMTTMAVAGARQDLQVTSTVRIDAESEYNFFSGGPSTVAPHNFLTSALIQRADDAASTAALGPDSAFTVGDQVGRVIVQPGTLTAPRTYTLTHTDAPPAGIVIDVWTQGSTLTVVYSATTLLTVAASSAPQRFFFFALASGAFALIGQQYLMLPSGSSPPAVPTLTAPGSVAVFNTVAVTVSATSPDGDLTRIDWVLDPGGGEVVVATDATAPYSTLWTPTGITPGDHTLVARAVRGATHTDSTPTTINVGDLLFNLVSGGVLRCWQGDFGADDAGGGACDSWTDVFASVAAVAAGTAQPTIVLVGKHLFLDFNGDGANTNVLRDGTLDLPGPTVGTPTFVYAIIEQRAWEPNGGVFSAGASALMSVGDLTSSPNMAQSHNVSGPLNNGATLGALVRLQAYFSNTPSDFLKLGSVVVSGTALGPSNPAPGFNIGSYFANSAGVASFAGRIGVMMVTNVLPSNTELTNLDSCCAAMYPGLIT